MLVKKEQIPVNIPFIKRIGTRKKGKVEKNLLIGLGTGLALGFLGASNADEDSLINGSVIVIPTLIGGLLGLIVGSSSKSHDLNNKTEIEKLKNMGIISGF